MLYAFNQKRNVTNDEQAGRSQVVLGPLTNKPEGARWSQVPLTNKPGGARWSSSYGPKCPRFDPLKEVMVFLFQLKIKTELCNAWSKVREKYMLYNWKVVGGVDLAQLFCWNAKQQNGISVCLIQCFSKVHKVKFSSYFFAISTLSNDGKTLFRFK